MKKKMSLDLFPPDSDSGDPQGIIDQALRHHLEVISLEPVNFGSFDLTVVGDEKDLEALRLETGHNLDEVTLSDV